MFQWLGLGVHRLMIICVLLTLYACAPGGMSKKQGMHIGRNQGLLTFYLQVEPGEGAQKHVEISQLALLDKEGWVEVVDSPVSIDRSQAFGRQLLLGIGLAPAHEYQRLRFRLSEDGGAAKVVEVSLGDLVRLEEGSSKCIFISWQPHSDAQGAEGRPAFKAWPQKGSIGKDLCFVVCSDVDTVYAINSDSLNVVGALGVRGPLGEAAVSPDGRHLYVLSSSERAIFEFDAVTFRLQKRIALDRLVSPVYLTLSDEESEAFVSDSLSGLVVRVDLVSGSISGQLYVGPRPERLLYFTDGGGWVAVSSPAAQRVHVFSASSLAVLREIPVPFEPDALAYFDGRLHVAQKGSDALSVADYRTGVMLPRITVGRAPSLLLALSEDVLVAGSRAEGTLSLLARGQNMVYRKIPTGTGLQAGGFSAQRQLLYLADGKGKRVMVYDSTGWRLKAEIPMGGSPFSIAVLD